MTIKCPHCEKATAAIVHCLDKQNALAGVRCDICFEVLIVHADSESYGEPYVWGRVDLVDRYRRALEEIAEGDYRGNRSPESALAYRALRGGSP